MKISNEQLVFINIAKYPWLSSDSINVYICRMVIYARKRNLAILSWNTDLCFVDLKIAELLIAKIVDFRRIQKYGNVVC